MLLCFTGAVCCCLWMCCLVDAIGCLDLVVGFRDT